MMNMAYCRFSNTLDALRECINALDAISSPRPIETLSEDEQNAARRLLTLCHNAAKTYGPQA